VVKGVSKLINNKNLKSSSFWVILFCALVVLSQLILKAFGITFEITLIVEVFSLLIAFFVSIGVLSANLKNKDGNILEIKDEIKKNIDNNLNQLSNKVNNLEDKNKNKKDLKTTNKNLDKNKQ